MKLKKLNFNYDYGLKIRIGEICNLNCWFCAQDSELNKLNKKRFDLIPKFNKELIEKVLPEVNKALKSVKNSRIQIEIIGGEPTLFCIDEFLNSLDLNHTNKIDISIISNGTKIDVIKKCFDICSNRGIHIKFSISLHETEIDVFKTLKALKALEKTYDSKFVRFAFSIVQTEDNKQIINDLLKVEEKIIVAQQINSKFDKTFDKNKIKWLLNDEKIITKELFRDYFKNKEEHKLYCKSSKFIVLKNENNEVTTKFYLCNSNNKIVETDKIEFSEFVECPYKKNKCTLCSVWEIWGDEEPKEDDYEKIIKFAKI